jgi:hypothetical protein
MKSLPIFVSLLLLATASWDALAQATFTKITAGTIVNDGGSSYACAWGDYDNDGYIDLVVGNGWGGNNFLYRNNRDGTFARITTGPIAEDVADTGGVGWADYDNDGDLDLFVSNFSAPIKDRLYRNDGNGNFTSITTGPLVNDAGVGTGVAWGDYDRDGWLDLHVSNVDQQNNFLYRNLGNGSFAQITSGPVVMSGGGSQACTWTDYDNDGDLDLFVANFNTANPGRLHPGQNDFLFRNDGAGNFTRITQGPLVTDGAKGSTPAWGDYDNDGDLDLFVTNTFDENDRLYENLGNGTFRLVADSVVANDGASNSGAAWADYDNDGWLDLFVCGVLGNPNRLYRNNGDGTFTQVTDGDIAAEGGISSACAWGDYDNDGFLDLFVANAGEDGNQPGENNNYLYHNTGNSNSWFVVKLIGGISNRSAIGAKVRLRATIGGRTIWQMREISGGSGSQNDMRAHFGLGESYAYSLRVEWPSGEVTEKTFEDRTTNRIMTVIEPSRLTSLGAGRFKVHGPADIEYSIYHTDNFSVWRGGWLVTGGTEFVDSEVPNHAMRFYRAVGPDTVGVIEP